MPFIGRTIQEVFPGEHKLFSWLSLSVASTKSNDTSVPTLAESKNQEESESTDKWTPVIVSKTVPLAPVIHQVEQTSTSIEGLLNIKPFESRKRIKKKESSPPMELLALFSNDLLIFSSSIWMTNQEEYSKKKLLRLHRDRLSASSSQSLKNLGKHESTKECESCLDFQRSCVPSSINEPSSTIEPLGWRRVQMRMNGRVMIAEE